jgi:hypothetical protein
MTVPDSVTSSMCCGTSAHIFLDGTPESIYSYPDHLFFRYYTPNQLLGEQEGLACLHDNR